MEDSNYCGFWLAWHFNDFQPFTIFVRTIIASCNCNCILACSNICCWSTPYIASSSIVWMGVTFAVDLTVCFHSPNISHLSLVITRCFSADENSDLGTAGNFGAITGDIAFVASKRICVVYWWHIESSSQRELSRKTSRIWSGTCNCSRLCIRDDRRSFGDSLIIRHVTIRDQELKMSYFAIPISIDSSVLEMSWWECLHLLE
jgi:hypothetical protein